MNRWIASTLLVLIVLLLFGHESAAQKISGKPAKEFQAFLKKFDESQRALQNGDPKPFKSMWSRSDDATLSGGFGGTIEKGWSSISKRLDWVATQFSGGTHTIDRLVTDQSGNLAYVAQLEHIDFVVPGTGKKASRDYRVTMVFRREPAGWRIVHRQADSQMTKEGPK